MTGSWSYRVTTGLKHLRPLFQTLPINIDLFNAVYDWRLIGRSGTYSQLRCSVPHSPVVSGRIINEKARAQCCGAAYAAGGTKPQEHCATKCRRVLQSTGGAEAPGGTGRVQRSSSESGVSPTPATQGHGSPTHQSGAVSQRGEAASAATLRSAPYGTKKSFAPEGRALPLQLMALPCFALKYFKFKYFPTLY